MAEREQRFRHDTARREQRIGMAHSSAGQLSALLVAIAFGWWAYDLIRHGHDVAGSVLAVADLGVLVGQFLRPRG